MEKIKGIIRKKLKEMNATNVGGATAVPGNSIGMSTKKAFKKVNEGPGASLGMGPSAGSEGVKDNAYVKQFKYKLVPKKIKGSGLEVKNLMNEIQPLVSNAKNETIELYGGNAGSYDINKPIEIVLSYLKEIKQLLSEN